MDTWKEIVRLEPKDPRNWLGLARAALRLGDVETARTALVQLKQSGRANADYYRLSAGVALLSRDNRDESALIELARLQPADLRMQLNLAIVRLHSPDPATVEAGRTALTGLARADQVRIRAVVELLSDMARRWPQPARERIAAFNELARALALTRGPRDESSLAADPVERLIIYAMRQPAPEPEDAGALLSWLILNGRAAAGFAWWENLPADTRNSRLVTAAASEAALQTADWAHLRELLLAGAWGALPAAAVNGAFAAREARSQAVAESNAGRWTAVIESCQSSLPALRALVRLSEAWHWPEEQRQVLMTITRIAAGETWAWRRLISQALAQSESEQLWEIYQRWSRAAPRRHNRANRDGDHGIVTAETRGGRGQPHRRVCAPAARQRRGRGGARAGLVARPAPGGGPAVARSPAAADLQRAPLCARLRPHSG